MIRDGRELNDGEVISADVCIIGAGAAGITIARAFIGTGLKVCLLEAGGLEIEDSDQELSNARNIGLSYRGLNYRGRAFGGSTHYWAGMCAPLAPEDFETRDGFNLSGWPINRAELDPYYLRAQRTCEVGGFDYDTQALSERRDEPTLPLDPARVETVVYHLSPPTRFGSRYRDDFTDAPDVDVYLYTVLERIELNEAGDSVTRLYARTDEREVIFEARCFCLAMGGVENARHLLAHSTSDESRADERSESHEGLGNQSGHLGLFLEHPHYIPGAYMLLRDWSDLRFYRAGRVLTFDALAPEGKEASVYGALSLSAEVRARENLPAHACTVRSVDLEDELSFADAESALGLEAIAPLLRASGSEYMLCKLSLRCEQRPDAACRISLNWSERDRFNLPIAELNWQVTDADHEGYARTLALIGVELGRAGLGRMFTPTSSRRRYAPGTPTGGWHHMGTTRMSASPAGGVVDANCRLHTVDNLYVAGSSTFATGGYVNPTLTIVALAHRLSDHLIEELT